ncbi:Zn-ribbon domain-containing OB-fold protein [Candidatus Woesearchaeota archaeon]|nr:Zn-ribbon domain-containing OB-fold protein [Candidatus Woesearchaeota archaeon]
MPANIWRRMPSFYSLAGSECMKCSSLYFPASKVCKKCGSQEISERVFEGAGEVVTYTVVRQGFNDDSENEKLVCNSPYIISIVKLMEGPMVTAQMADCEPEEMKIGARVKAVFRKISEEGEEGLIRYGYKFVLA